ncbi:precorrin-6A reductase [Litoribrevibacter albus]|uniref:Cobalt-precorrin-6A reductase n=1 Tax=Litoribrevibacter albus TaxID=1473156 RepID=A0AA37S653_9GAMM|nr:precorrin-6A reductase [Litoribrevibacter albus]GLQ29946.1 cobalt-precorrin-6A reductase [Litoribrevibacter albus]
MSITPLSKVLVLGGTSEGKAMVNRLLDYGVPVVYSIAGLVRTPEFKQSATLCEIIDGGFSSYGGLAEYLNTHSIVGVCDATHPFAKNISATAWKTCSELGIPYWRFQRSEWPKQPKDDWQDFTHWPPLLNSISLGKTVFFSAGQLNDECLQWLLAHPHQQIKHLWRTAVEPKSPLPDNLIAVKAIGPFTFESERQLFTEHKVDVLVTKNSGGEATIAKIQVARELGLPVLMLARPTPVPENVCYDDLNKLAMLIISQLKLNHMMQVH